MASPNDYRPVLLGSDATTYGMARNFYALTGQPVDAFARNQLVPTRWSHIVHVHVVPELDQDATFVAAMHDVAARYDEQDGPLLLVLALIRTPSWWRGTKTNWTHGLFVPASIMIYSSN